MEHAGITLSIIIPVYNVMAYLRPCLDGLLNQTCPAGFSYEVLLADDGSTDGSGAVCEEYAKAFRQVRVLHRENGGQSAARNQAIRAAEGAWLAFVDSDDLVRPEFLAALAGVPGRPVCRRAGWVSAPVHCGVPLCDGPVALCRAAAVSDGAGAVVP